MFLSKLEIFGFKSFYQKTALKFTEGITCVVGPNGCGKTNVVDGMRWVLGEQRASVLRSDKMESVIFNGTKKLRPLGLAEVSLTIENVKAVLKTEYSEVTITRRLYRSGESEYLINKTVVRLRDVIDLFMDSGMGFNAYSVIELKMIELILNDKTNERRKMFEEAAGVTKYKQRRHATLKKLENVQQDLTRVQDIIVEVDKVVRSLERQAKKAEQYNKLTEELRGLELELIEREYNDIKNSLDPLKKRLDGIKISKMKVDTDLSSFEANYESLRKDLLELEEQLSNARQSFAENSDEIKKKEHNVILQKERSKSLSQQIVRYESENNNLAQEIQELQNLIERDKTLIQRNNDELDTISDNFANKEDELRSLEIRLAEKNNEIKINTEKKIDLNNQISSIKNRHQNIKFQVDSIRNRNENISKEVQTSIDEFKLCEEQLKNLEEQSRILNNKVIECEEEFHRKENEKNEIRAEVERLQQKSFEIQSSIGKNISKIDFLKGLIEKNIGLSESVQFLSRKSDWIDRPVITVAEAVNSDSKHRIAIEAALGDYSNYIIVNNADEATSGIEFLKKTNHGKATFICLDRINKLNIESSSISADGGLKATEVIKCNDDYRNLFNYLLKDIFIFDDIEPAQRFSNTNKGVISITNNGEIITSSGIIRGGSKRLDEGTLIGKKEQIKELLEEVELMKNELDENQKVLQSKNDYFDSINIKKYADNIVSARNDLAEHERKIFEIQVKKDNLETSLEKISSEKNKLNLENDNLSVELNDTLPIINKFEEDLNEIEDTLEMLSKNHDEMETQRSQKNRELNEVNIILVSKKGEIQNLEKEIERSLSSVENITKSIERHNYEISEFKIEIERISEIVIEEENALSQLLKRNDELQIKRDEIQNIYSKKREEVEEVEKVIKTERKQHEESANEINELELKYSELKMRAENLRIKATDEYQIELQTKLFEDMDQFNFNEAKDRIRSVKDRISGVGPVNLLAFSEYQTEKERLDFLVTQKDDLLEAEKSLVQTIEEINETAKVKFDETFQQIRTNFIAVFKTLFDEGDEADLRFTEDVDPLEGEIQIIAKPRGKRPQTIDSLSGGEKTLTAISLLFAIYLVKPSPFCILDEVDAPLDDANVDRFVKILRKFSDKTQFIVVTHNKRTMEAGDSLYGVTMEEEGVSKVVSVNFNDDFSFTN